MARTGEPRKTKQPLKIDRLPVSAIDAILRLRNREGKTWNEIARLSAEPVGDGLPGFVEWKKLDLAVLELFPEMRIPRSNLHRWYDIRVAQVRRDVLDRSEQARTIAEAFAASVVANGDEAVVNAARDTFMSVLAEDSTQKGRAAAGKALIALAEVMQGARANDIKERKVAVDERKMAQLEADAELRRKRLDEDTKKVAKKGELTLDDINTLRRNAFGLPPLGPDGQVVPA